MKKEIRRTYVNKNKMGIMYNRENCCKPVEGKHMIDLETWARKEHYAHFASLDDPFFGICAKADFTGCYRQAKNDNASFFLYSLHRILKAANRIEEFRYRIEDGNIVLYDRINASPTIGREDRTLPGKHRIKIQTDERQDKSSGIRCGRHIVGEPGILRCS